MHLILSSLADAAGMFWDTLWALVLGFALSGAVQAFISRSSMQRTLGSDSPSSIVKASLFGAISSSCSYAASALAKTLFARGASFRSSMSFMFASTNLVVELGIVLWLLLSWHFALAEFVGGAIMILILSFLLRLVPTREVEAARTRLADRAPTHHDHSPHDHSPHDHSASLDSASSPSSPRTLRGWADAAAYTISDLTMLRRELLLGFLVAGVLDVAVPTSFWSSLFLSGHGFWTSLEGVLLAPLVALLSFVCSVGNVPLAASLWTGGASFGATVAFVFADLLAFPLLLIYARYYGPRLTLRLTAIFWASISLAALLTEALFALLRLTPAPALARHGHVGSGAFGWNATSFLDVLALLALLALYLLYRRQASLGGGTGLARDPVCGMQVQTTLAPASRTLDSKTLYFCSDHCAHRFDAAPASFLSASQDSSARPSPDHTHDHTHDHAEHLPQ